MTKRMLYLSALFLTLCTVALWQWQHFSSQRRLARRTQWQAYLQGPLSDYLYASTRSDELLKKSKLKPAERAALGEAVTSMRKSYAGVSAARDGWEEDNFFQDLVRAAEWHSQALDLAEAWLHLDLKDQVLMQNLGQASSGVRHNLAIRLDSQRTKVLAELKPRQAELLEMNALIYAVKEGTTVAKIDKLDK